MHRQANTGESAIRQGSRPFSATNRQRLAIVGDVHDAWGPRDEAALRCISGLSMVLFVGDFGNENVRLVKHVSELPLPKAVILGNHDAWYTMIPKRRKESLSQLLSSSELLALAPALQPPDGPTTTAPVDRFSAVEAQIRLLGKSHVGFSSLPISESGGGLSVLGGRPFAKGGPVEDLAQFYERLHGIQTEDEFASKIVEEGKKAAAAGGSIQAKHSLVLLAHNGPVGLGASPSSIVGIDWKSPGGDYGDRELTRAIASLKQDESCSVPLVVFGHMHHMLRGGGMRQMVAVDHADPSSPTVYLNAATVPRVRSRPISPPPSPAAVGKTIQRAKRPRGYLKSVQNKSQSSSTDPKGPPSQHHFLIVDMDITDQGDYIASSASDVWIQVAANDTGSEGEPGHGFDALIAEENSVLRLETDGSYTYWDAHNRTFISSRLGATAVAEGSSRVAAHPPPIVRSD